MVEKEKEKEKKPNVIITKYIPLLLNKYIEQSLEKVDLEPDKDHEQCYIIKKGSVLSRDTSGRTNTLFPGEPIGFAEALLSRPYELRYFLKEDTEVYTFKSSDIRQSISGASSLTRGMIKYSLDRVFNTNKSKTYHLIDDGFLSKNTDGFPIKDYKDQDTVFMINQKPKFFFYVETGKVNLISKSNEIIASFSAGDSFGEMALFTGSVRSVTAKAEGNTVLQLVSADFIKSYFENEDIFIKFTLICVLERLRAMNKLRNLIK